MGFIMKYILLFLTSLLSLAQTAVRSEQIINWQQINLQDILSKDLCVSYPALPGHTKKLVSCDFSKYALNTVTAIQQSQLASNTSLYFQADILVRNNYCLNTIYVSNTVACYYFPIQQIINYPKLWYPNLVVTIFYLPVN